MAKTLKGITIEFDGDTSGLTQALKKVDGETKKVQTELKNVENLLKFDPSNTVLLAQKQELLGKAVSNTETRLDALKKAQTEVEREFKNGNLNEDQYRKFQRELIATEGQLKSLKGQLKSVDAKLDVEVDTSKLDKVKSGLKEIESVAKETGKKIGDGLSKGFEVGAKAAAGVGVAALGAAAGVSAFVESQKEMNMDLARLRANAETAGFGLEFIENSFKKVAAVSGETDSAIEAVSNLMATDMSENQLGQMLDYVNAGAIKFSDTLKTEGIADGIQETFATGKAIGPFSELLERSGVDLEKFDEGLAKAKKNGNEVNYTLETLANTGLASTLEQYNENNKALNEYNQAQLDSQLKMAELATTMQPFVTMLMEMGNILLDVVLGNKSFAEGMGELIEIVKGLAETLFIAAKEAIPGFIQGIKESLPSLLESGMEMSAKISEGIWNEVPKLLNMALDLISLIVGTLIENSPQFLATGVNVMTSLINGITGLLPKIQKTGLDLLLKLVQTIISNLPEIISAAFRIVNSLITGLLKALPQMTSYLITQFIPAIIKTIVGADWLGIGKSIIKGLIDGIGSMKDFVIDIIEDTIGSAIKFAKKLLGINSPSKVFFEMGEGTNEGYINGIQKSSKALFAAVNNVYGSIASSAEKSISGTAATASTSTTSIDNSRNISPTYHIYTTESPEKALKREWRKMAFQF